MDEMSSEIFFCVTNVFRSGKSGAVAGETYLNHCLGERHSDKKIPERAENNLITHITSDLQGQS